MATTEKLFTLQLTQSEAMDLADAWKIWISLDDHDAVGFNEALEKLKESKSEMTTTAKLTQLLKLLVL